MAILKDLIVSGSSRLLGKLYTNDIEIGNDVEVDGKTTTAQLYVKTTMNNTTNSSVDSNNLPFVVGTISGNHIVMDSDEITAKSGATGTSNLWINYGGGQINLGNGGKVNVNDGTLSAHILKASTSLGATNAYVPNAYITTGNITTANTNTINNATNIYNKNGTIETDVIKSNKWEIVSTQNLGGDFFVAPTIMVTNGSTFTISSVSGKTITGTLKDTTNITSANFGGHTWSNNSLIKITGKLTTGSTHYILGTCDGKLTAQMNNTANTINFQITCNASTVPPAGTYTITDGTVMMYNVGGSNKVGIYMTCYGTDKYTYIDIYNGSNGNIPVARLGKLDNLKDSSGNRIKVGDALTTDYGIYTKNGFFEGKVVANGGTIAGWTIGDGYITTNSNRTTYDNTSYTGMTMTSSGIGARGSATSYFNLSTGGGLTAVGATVTGTITANSGYIGGWTINNSYGIYTNNKTSATSTNSGILIQKDGGIYAGAYNSTNKSCPFQVTSAGALTAQSGKIGRYNITATYLDTGSGTSNAGMGGNQAFWAGNTNSNSAPFRVSYTGDLVATSATITGSITAKSFSALDPDSNERATVNANGFIVKDASNNTVASLSNAIKFYDGSGTADSNITAQFTSSGVNIGKINESQINVYSNSIQITNPQGAEIFSVNSDGAQVSGGMVERKTLAVAGGTSTAATTVKHVARITESVETGMNIDVTFDNITEGLTRTWSVIKGTAATNIGQYTEMSLTYDGQNNFSFNFNNHWTGTCRIELRCILSSIPTPTYSLGTRGHGQRGAFSTIIGEDLIASGRGQVIIGEKNEEDPDKVFIIGGGFNYDGGSGEIQEFRDNILTVDWNGNVQCGDIQGGDVQCNNIKCGYITGQLIQNNSHREYTVTFDEPFPDSGPLPIVVASLVAQSSDTGYADVTVSVGTRTRSDCKIHIFNKSGSGRTPHLMWMATTAGCQEQ